MLKTLKRKIALVAVAALGAGGLSIVAAPAANAAGGTAVTAVSTTAPAVRVSFTNTTLDAVGVVPLTITNHPTYAVGNIGGGDEATITLTSAPSAAATLVVASTQANGNTGTGNAANFGAGNLVRQILTLAAPTQSIQNIARVTATGGTTRIWVAANVAGTYSGTIVTDNNAAGGQQQTATFSFTTVGAPASFALDSTAQSVPAGGRSSWSASVKDANGNATILGVYDSIGVTCSPACTNGNAANGLIATVALAGAGNVTAITQDRIAAGSGTAGVVHRASGTAGASTTLSFRALGVISALGTQTATVTETAQVISTDLIIATPTITTTPTAGAVTGSLTVPTNANNGWQRQSLVKTGTTAVTVGFTAPTAGLGEEFRFEIAATAGTVDGVAFTTPVYKTAVASATTGAGSISFTLGGAALLTGATVTVKQVDVIGDIVAPANHAAGQVNATLGDIRGILLHVTQADATFAGAGITTSPSGAVVAKLGATTDVVVSIANSYEEALGAGYVVRVYRTSVNGTLLGSAVTAADGTAKVSVTNATTLTAAGSEVYAFQVQPPTGGAVNATDTLTINYTTTGAVTSLSVAITNAGGTPTSPITNATLASAVTRIPIVYIPSDGVANTAAERSRILATATTAAADDAVATVTASGAGEYFTLVATPSSATPVTWTGSDGVRFCSTTAATTTATSCRWDTGVATVTSSSTNFIHVYSLKTGTQTVTAAVGDVKATLSFVARNRVIDGYNIILTPATQSLDSGAYGTVKLSVTDIFGNAVAAAAGDVTVSVTGPALLSGLAASASPATTATTGADLTVIASTTGSGDATIAGAPGAATAATAWATTYVKPTNAPDPIKAASAKVTVKAAAASAAQTAETTAIKADVKAVSDTVATLSKAVTTIQSSVTELTSSFSAQIKSLSSAIAKISRAIAALSKRIK